jgi:ABC-type Mn2+/Zn2+ transport system ATPase subunit
MDYVIELEHVTVRYQALIALEDITLQMASGEFLALIGPNGSGKTTLIKTILGLVRPTTGTIRLFGQPPQRLKGGWKRIGYVPQIAGVDVGTTEGLFDLLDRLHAQGMTILVVSHDIGVVAQHADQVACLNRRLVAHGRPQEVLDGDVLQCMYGSQAALVGHGVVPPCWKF